MRKFNVGCGMAGIYAGILSKDKTQWISKSEVTDDAIMAVAQFLMQKDEIILFEKYGKKYKMEVREAADE